MHLLGGWAVFYKYTGLDEAVSQSLGRRCMDEYTSGLVLGIQLSECQVFVDLLCYPSLTVLYSR